MDTEKISPFADLWGHEIMIYFRSESKLDDVKQCLWFALFCVANYCLHFKTYTAWRWPTNFVSNIFSVTKVTKEWLRWPRNRYGKNITTNSAGKYDYLGPCILFCLFMYFYTFYTGCLMDNCLCYFILWTIRLFVVAIFLLIGRRLFGNAVGNWNWLEKKGKMYFCLEF